ncbi:MAG: adenylate kinase [Leptonema sp. (in: bacteria)]
MINIVFMGPPGAGKGTQAKFICNEYKIPQISTGEILRNAMNEGTELGEKAKEFVESGKLVPDEIVIGIVKERIQKSDCERGFLLDGFPRTLKQAQELDNILSELNKILHVVINIDVSEKELVERLLRRAKIEGRSDDTEEVIRARMKTYFEQTYPLIEYYKEKKLLRNIDGLGSVEEITSRIKEALKNV